VRNEGNAEVAGYRCVALWLHLQPLLGAQGSCRRHSNSKGSKSEFGGRLSEPKLELAVPHVRHDRPRGTVLPVKLCLSSRVLRAVACCSASPIAWRSGIISNPSRIAGLTTAQMVEVDRAMIGDFRIELIQMMGNAGRNLAYLAGTRFLGGDPRAKRVIARAGGCGNGGSIPSSGEPSCL